MLTLLLSPCMECYHDICYLCIFSADKEESIGKKAQRIYQEAMGKFSSEQQFRKSNAVSHCLR